MTSLEVKKNLLDGLGKATLRGVRRCPKCGTFNGTRGVSCKNKDCDVIFKETEHRTKKPACSDAVKIVTGTSALLYSVRTRDRGPDYRGFVQLPLIQELGSPGGSDDAEQGSSLDESSRQLVAESTAKCHICKKNDLNSELDVESCWHLKAAMNCYVEAVPLTLKNSILNLLAISSETKQAIWCLATETTGPLVQRVSKNVMVVKCKATTKHSLGFLHFSFFESSRKQTMPEPKFLCSCKAFKSCSKLSNKSDALAQGKVEAMKRCVHFYACVCAFASDEKLSEEFSHYISMSTEAVTIPENSRIVTLYSDTECGDIKFEVVPADDKVALLSSDSCEIISSINDDSCELLPVAKKHKTEEYVTLVDEATGQTSKNILLTLLSDPEKPSQVPKSTTSKKTAVSPSPVKKQGSATIDESSVFISFHQWLASVTERINQTMHYQFSGNPDPLVFHSPQCFFDCLQHRISNGYKKMRLPNSTTAFVRKDALPLGTFTKYSWQITNILHVKHIFDTPEMPLDITRSFVQNHDGTYDLFVPQESDSSNSFRKTGNNPLIKPSELKTYLRVGNTSPDQKEPTPFIIEWIPDILPVMKIGELRINFEYGHQRNGQLEVRSVPTNQEAEIIQIEEI